jgi:hypothetical protein
MWITSDEFNFFDACSMVGCSTASQTTSESTSLVNMGRYQSMVAVVTYGNTLITTSNCYVRAFPTITSAATETTGTVAPYWNYRYASSGTDTLSARAACATTGVITLASTNGSIYLLEIKSDDLPAGYPYVAVSVSSAANQRAVSIVYVMKPRYPEYDFSKVTAIT